MGEGRFKDEVVFSFGDFEWFGGGEFFFFVFSMD